MSNIFGPNTALIAKVMDMRLERQNLVMSNLANINVPNYKARSLEFESELQTALGTGIRDELTRTNRRHVPTPFNVEKFSGDVLREFKPRTIYGQDSVDLDKEMATMAKNSLMYNALTTVVKSGFEGIQKVITEGGK
ncbi:flagellar basal body rod protein FlgB [Fundidesulfovibrio butyratiphilus]